jgi:hypothetical protein
MTDEDLALLPIGTLRALQRALAAAIAAAPVAAVGGASTAPCCSTPRARASCSPFP